MRPPILQMVLHSTLAATAELLAQGQGTISDAPATYVIPSSHYDTTPAANFTGVAPTLATDHLFETGWWYRVAGDPAEKFFPVPGSPNFPPGAMYTVSWTNVDGRGFDAVEYGDVLNLGGPSGAMTFQLTLHNTGPAPITLELFHLVDVDLQATPADDSAILLDANSRIRINDASQSAEYLGFGASAFLVRPFDSFGLFDVAGLLSDPSVTNFDSSGLPFGPGDLTAGFQWAGISLAPGGRRIILASIAVNAGTFVNLIFFDGFESGNTHVWSTQFPP